MRDSCWHLERLNKTCEVVCGAARAVLDVGQVLLL